MEILKPYRDSIDAIDEEIIKLLRKRYDVIEEVGHLKAREDIDATLPDRVDAVREHAAGLAAAAGLDEAFIRQLYTQLIRHSCALEEEIITTQRQKKAS